MAAFLGVIIENLTSVMASIVRKESHSTAKKLIFGVDIEGRITIWNKSIQNLTEFSLGEAIGQSLTEQFIAPEHKTRMQDVINLGLAGEETADFSESSYNLSV